MSKSVSGSCPRQHVIVTDGCALCRAEDEIARLRAENATLAKRVNIGSCHVHIHGIDASMFREALPDTGECIVCMAARIYGEWGRETVSRRSIRAERDLLAADARRASQAFADRLELAFAENAALAAALEKCRQAVCMSGFRKPLEPGDEGCEVCGKFFESRNENETGGVCDLCAQTILQDVESVLALDPLCAAALDIHAKREAVIQAARGMDADRIDNCTSTVLELRLRAALAALDAASKEVEAASEKAGQS